MTFDEALSRYDSFINQINKSLEFSLKFEHSTDIFSPRISEILEKVAQLYCDPPHLKLLENMSEKFTFLQSNAFVSALDASVHISDAVAPSLLNRIEISYELAERISNIVSNAASYIPEDIHEAYIETAPDVLGEKPNTFLTFDRAIALLGLLITLYTAIVTQLPNPQLTKISQQNEQLISIEEKRLELERNQTEMLEDIADHLRDVIVDLNEQIEVQTEQFDIFSKQTENAGNLDVFENQDKKADSQENNANTEN